MKRLGPLFVAGVITLVVLAAGATVDAQQKGQYLPGTCGLNSGIQAGPGFTYSNLFTCYKADKLKGADGETIPTVGDAGLYVDQNLFIYVTKYKVLGANIGFMLDVPIANASLTAPVLGLTGGGIGIADIYVEPLNLGWHLKHADIKAAYGFMAPTGRYNDGATDNIGSGYWGHLLSLSGTYYLDKTRTWSISTNGVFEVHQQKKDSVMTPGRTFTFEYGVGKMLPVGKQLLQLGLIGYGQWQVSDNGGGVLANTRGRYGVAAIGPEVTLIVPRHKLSLTFRYEPELYAASRIQGSTFVFSGALSF